MFVLGPAFTFRLGTIWGVRGALPPMFRAFWLVFGGLQVLEDWFPLGTVGEGGTRCS